MGNDIAKPDQAGMTFQPSLPFEEWEEIGRRFGEATKRFSWALGDWLVYGGTNFKKRISAKLYEEAEKVTGVDRQSLLALATVCRRIPKEQRLPHLTFEHHQAVASISNQDKRQNWLSFLGSQEIVPPKKILKLSINCSPDDPKIITSEEYQKRNRGFAKDNYVPHLTRLLTVLRRTIPIMDQDELEALKADTEPLVTLVESISVYEGGR